jgi:hypothetical protein
VRRAIAWFCSVLGFSVALYAAFGFSWGCALPQPGKQDLFCTFMSQRPGKPLILGSIVVGHTIASVIAVAISPAHRRIVGILAVALPLIAWVATDVVMSRAPLNVVATILMPILLVIPVAACTVLFIRRLERRRESVA